MFKALTCFPLFYLGLVTACTSSAGTFHKQALNLNLTEQTITTNGFKHQLYTKNIGSTSKVLHVYLDGDGTPWLAQRYLNQDPTPTSFTVLQLMQEDSKPSLYLGRPCYHQQQNEAVCQPNLWTTARYSSLVVDDMIKTLQSYLASNSFKQVVLIGFSGGGTLAVLIAAKIPDVTQVITLAGNLDIEAWTNYHHYQPLTASLNPATQTALPKHIYQIHLMGEKDQTIKPVFSTRFIQKEVHAHLKIIPNADHHCCWQAALTEALEAASQ